MDAKQEKELLKKAYYSGYGKCYDDHENINFKNLKTDFEEWYKTLSLEKEYLPQKPDIKLKAAAEDIKEICRKYDIAGAFGLHSPGHGEFVLHLNPSYSSVYMYNDNEIRFYSKRKDFKSDEEQLQKQADTANMLRLLTDLTANNFMMLKKLADHVDERTGANHTKP